MSLPPIVRWRYDWSAEPGTHPGIDAAVGSHLDVSAMRHATRPRRQRRAQHSGRRTCGVSPWRGRKSWVAVRQHGLGSVKWESSAFRPGSSQSRQLPGVPAALGSACGGLGKGLNFGDFVMAPSSQKLEPPPNPGRFTRAGLRAGEQLPAGRGRPAPALPEGLGALALSPCAVALHRCIATGRRRRETRSL